MKKKLFHSLKVIFYTLFGCIFLLVSYFSIGNLVNRDPYHPTSVGDYCVYNVLTDSMFPTLEAGDIFVAKKTKDVIVGDIVIFVSKQGEMNGKVVTHRVTKTYLQNGIKMFVTRGDGAAGYDEPIAEDQIVGKMVYRLHFLSFASRVFRSGIGFFVLVFVPFLGLLIYQLVRFIKIIKRN